MPKIKNEKDLANRLYNARTLDDVQDIKDYLSKHTWRPVGGRPNNAGIIDVGTSPGAALVERITNGADAMLELAFALKPGQAKTPFEAAVEYYGVPVNGLAGMTDAKRRKLAENISVSLHDSGIDRRPTVVVHDKGIGLTPEMAPDTILSLNDSNKLSKLYLMGTYNQGGSASLSFSKVTIVISRRHGNLLNGYGDRIAFTIIEQRDDSTKKVASYEYMSQPDGTIFGLSPSSLPKMTHGTRIIHIGFDLQIAGPWSTDPYYFLQAALPSLPLPYLFGGDRTKPWKDPNSDRPMIGNAARLNDWQKAKGDIEVPHLEDAYQDLGMYGKIRVRYWVVRRPLDSDKTSDALASYVQPKTAISISLNGQRQDTESRAWINARVKLPYLHKNLVVQIDADQLTQQAKKELFSSVRERARQSDVRNAIYERVAELLTDDDELRRLDDEERQRQLKRTTKTVNDKLRKRLSKWIKTAIKGEQKPGKGQPPMGGGDGGTPKSTSGKSGGSSTPRDTDDTHLPLVPTELKFERDAVTVDQGGRAHVMVAINAKNGYLPDHDAELSITVDGPDPSSVNVTTRTKLMGGKARWVIVATEDAPVGDYKVSASLTLPSGVVLDDVLPVTVKVPKPVSKDQGGGSEPETGPNVNWIVRSEWTAEWNEKKVGEIREGLDETDIIINRHFGPLDSALSAAGLTQATVELREDRYLMPVAYAVWAQKHELNKLAAAGEDEPSEEWLQRELARMAEAVIIAITPDEESEAED